MTQCPNCKEEKAVKVKERDMEHVAKGPALRVAFYKCEACGKKFRVATKI